MKTYKDTVEFAGLKSHAVRNRAADWDSQAKMTRHKGETFCGRWWAVTEKAKRGKVTCKTCLRALAAAA
jgi:hypothetical protein